MHLRSLRLRGFKSFPDPVDVALEPGVSVVVGPNGSGKSNVADAIVWAAGSLTPSELRAEKPDDVLFAGGGDRRPADHCEVELLFDNADGHFGELDYTEVSIARRLVRGGEGQYLVNRTPVRRTDLVELLADVGLGGSMHSIVGQGKVDAVLASRPEDRRALVEEAAGLGKFKRRRHRAELKLARVATQVERARDVEDEVRKRLRPLALQATAAERAEKLAGEIARLRARIADLDLEDVAERRSGAEERRDAAALARRRSQERLRALLEERQRAEDELSDAAGRREGAIGALYRLQGASERLALRREAAAGLETRLREELAELERAERGKDGVRTSLEAAAARAGAAARDVATASGRAAERARIAHARLAGLDRRAAAAAAARVATLARERSEVETALEETAGERDQRHRRLAVAGAARERLAMRAEAAESVAAALGADAREARSLARDGVTPAELERVANEATAAARAAVTERDDLTERARAARQRLTGLEAALAEREGLPPAARAFAAEGVELAVSLVDPEPGNERAAAAALRWSASAVLADDPAAALALLERAREAGLGSLTVLVGADPARLAAGLPVVPVEELLASGTAAVTSEGFGYDPERGELWFAGTTAEAVLLEMEARRRSLADEAEELAARAGAAARAADEAAARAGEAEAAFAAVAHLRGRDVDPAAADRRADCATALRHLTARALALATRVEETVAAGAAVGAQRSAELGGELRRLATAESDARREGEEASERARAAEIVVARLGGGATAEASEDADREELARDAEHSLAIAEGAAVEAREAADRADAAEAALAERTPRHRTLDRDLLGRLADAAGALGSALEAAAGVGARLDAPVRARVDAGSARTSALATELRTLGAAEVELRQTAEEAAERATAVQVELARLDAEADEARRRRELAGDLDPAEGDDRDELLARAERLDARRDALGRVNPLAKEEYAVEKARLEELAVQRDDLEQSLAELEKLRDELADTVERRFSETFAAVARNFEDVAATLFPGGEGRLRLVERDEEGEAGIEVELRPAGKKITRLSLLSGGEKALGAISFLFALFLAKPCPFYLLDEVEAALDDTNIARFIELLRRYAERAQFVVVTHQKRTMEAADVLYGVTMGDDGVSQIVSRRLPREDAPAALAGSTI
jgi:chromosome segregation protein